MKIYLLIFLVFFTGCSLKETKNTNYLTFEQNVSVFPIIDKVNSYDLEPLRFLFETRYFSPWSDIHSNVSVESAMWGFNSYGKSVQLVGENRLKVDSEYFTKLKDSANFENFKTINQKAITIKNTNLRVFPTSKPLFKSFDTPGEGFPFDYVQSSYVPILSPIFISHYSKDKSWAFVETSFATGWIKADDISFIDKREIKEFQKINKLTIVKDNVATFYKNGRFATYVKVGTILPLMSEHEESFESYLYDKDGNKNKIFINKDSATNFPLEFDDENIKKITNELLGEKYGWGGLFENRDCSAMIKDFFATFGIWVPRNSASQRYAGVYIDISTLSNEDKEKMLIKYGVPFLSIIYLRGHSMLYSGSIDGRVLAFHNIWGVKTIKDNKVGRFIIGKAVISDLYLGKLIENSNKKFLLIDRIEGFSVLAPTTFGAKSKLLKAYSKTIIDINDNRVIFKDNSSLIFDDGLEKNSSTRLENPDIKDQFFEYYDKSELKILPQSDAGRVRNEAFFKKLYGENEVEIEKNLVNVVWLKSSENLTLLFNKNEGAAKALQSVSDELDKLPEEFLKFLQNPGGTYKFRNIAGTNRLSMHSFGIAIDINVMQSNYWLWEHEEYEYKNKIPHEIVKIFEKYGFIWGGKWYHYDTMHFEYRPELFL